MAKTITIIDTGLNEIGGAVVFPQVISGNPVTIQATTIRGEFGTSGQSVDTLREDSTGDLTFNAPVVTAAIVPRFTIQGVIQINDVDGVIDRNETVNRLIKLRNSKGIKKISGGIALMASVPESFPTSIDYIYGVIKNVTFTENSRDSKDVITYTVQLEQVI